MNAEIDDGTRPGKGPKFPFLNKETEINQSREKLNIGQPVANKDMGKLVLLPHLPHVVATRL
jgi:hypothetical protein